jgi:hypothetical protein
MWGSGDLSHFANECIKNDKESATEGEAFVVIKEDEYDDEDELSFHQASEHVNPKWILLDNQSTTDFGFNDALMTNINDAGKIINIHFNAGTQCVIDFGTLKNYEEVWYSKDAITNIIFLPRVKERCPVKYDSTNGNQFIVVRPTKEVIFKQSELGLYYHDNVGITTVFPVPPGIIPYSGPLLFHRCTLLITADRRAPRSVSLYTQHCSLFIVSLFAS